MITTTTYLDLSPQIRVTPKGLERLRDVMASQALEVVP